MSKVLYWNEAGFNIICKESGSYILELEQENYNLEPSDLEIMIKKLEDWSENSDLVYSLHEDENKFPGYIVNKTEESSNIPKGLYLVVTKKEVPIHFEPIKQSYIPHLIIELEDLLPKFEEGPATKKIKVEEEPATKSTQEKMKEEMKMFLKEASKKMKEGDD